MQDIDFLETNTKYKIIGVGNDTSKGLGVTEVKSDTLSQMLDADTRLVFIIANLGDGTVTNVAPVIAQTCKQNNILTIGIVSIPVGLGGSNNIQQVNQEIGKIKESVDSIIVLDSQRLFNLFPNINHSVGLKKVDDLARCIVSSILGFIKTQGTINLDINDLKTIFKNGGNTYWGIGY